MALKKSAERPTGAFSALPHVVLDSQAWRGASHPACVLLIELLRQHNGSNNGRLHLSTGWLRKRGWLSVDVIQRAKCELIERMLIVKTRQGGLNAGADLYAITWLPITNFLGLDIRAAEYHRGAWNCFTEPEKQKKPSVKRNSAIPAGGTATPFTVPPAGTKPAIFECVAIPPNGNNVSTNVPSLNKRKRIVGKIGKSGTKTVAKKISPELIEYHQ